ncbi:amino acid-binding protein [Saccharobesus litoralis]|uniref:Glycine cleavage system transcriptional repressor n=1 Tax=Saccharobesus litoralis TaxID=2172099 RepID=A0A2S0VSW7_9ALTE|nr:ACT domain-containing protein [Saccharobesus litoralis]AWB67304.1 amino acid-binding protein [Saccharobesus litoralis]
MNTLVMSLITQDKPGIIENISNLVSEYKGSWQASNFCQLAGQFAGIVEIKISPEATEALSKALLALRQSGYTLDIVESSPNNEAQQACHVIAITGNDRPGIVKEVSSAIAKLGANVVRLNSKTSPAPNWGGELFHAEVEVKLSSDDLDQVKESLEQLADDLIVDINSL